VERRFDPPKPTGFSFNQSDVNEMRRVMQVMAELMRRMMTIDQVPPGTVAMALCNLAADLLRANYPEAFRQKLVNEIRRQIFDTAPADETPRLIRLH
jgi:hypothetical protein